MISLESGHDDGVSVERAGDEEVLRDCLTEILRDSHDSPVLHLTLRSSDYSSSFAAYIISVQMAGGEEHTVFFKDLGDCRRPVRQLDDRRIRELRVYQKVLNKAGLGTAEYLGSLWDESRERYWLFLEFVDGRPLKESGFEQWMPAARWLGSLSAYSVANAPFLQACDFLQRHDHGFFHATAQAAHAAVVKRSRVLARRLARILSGYAPVVEAMVSQPPVLTHGSYSREHILLAGHRRTPRLCPVDWESAGLGASLFDLAYLADGFTSADLDRIIDAYRDALGSYGIAVPGSDEILYLISAYCLHRTFKWLSMSWDEEFSEDDVERLVTRAERLAGSVH